MRREVSDWIKILNFRILDAMNDLITIFEVIIKSYVFHILENSVNKKFGIEQNPIDSK